MLHRPILYLDSRLQGSTLFGVKSCLPIIASLLIILAPHFAHALGPHEVAVLVNRNSGRSIRTAAEYARLRRVPAQNVILLDIPDRAVKPGRGISQDEFTRHIWTPVNNALGSRRIGDHILAWIYSLDFPVRINTRPPISIQGITFVRNRLPDSEAVALGTYASPLFAGPHSPRTRSYPAQSFDVLRAWLGDSMPIPSMMLGFAGERGNSPERILGCIRAGIASDGTAPTGTVFMVTGSDVRAKCRAWQFAGAHEELRGMGVHAVITDTPPSNSRDIVGMMVGAPSVSPETYGSYIPGAIGEHLTSFAAVFEDPAQTKLSAWIKAGATASAGTVTEPRANWRKFPSARVFVHYAAGCTVIEGLFQSVRCPLQILFVGEPLACPWAPRATATIRGIGNAPLSGKASIRLMVTSEKGRLFTRFDFLVDGRTLHSGTGAAIDIDTSTLSDGSHILRAIAYGTGGVRNQVFDEKPFTVANNAK